MASKVVAVGNCSGRKIDKFEKFDLPPLPAERVAAPLVAECFANFECREIDTTLVNRYNLYILGGPEGLGRSRAEASEDGGHTEVTQGLDRPILIGQVLGEVSPERLVRKSRIAVGDLVLLTRSVAIEGTAILAREKAERLRGRVDANLLARAARFLLEPGISVVSAALAAANVGEAVHGMHDPTEGGLATGLSELVAPGGLGLRVIREHIPVFPETNAICKALLLDPLKLIASGALLIVVEPDRAESVMRVIEVTGVPVVVVGEVRPSKEGITIVTNGTAQPLAPPARDEIARAFESG
jgi:hydrogenase maturation factor